MRILTIDEINQIDGAFLEALATLLLVFTAPYIIGSQIKDYGNVGRDLSRDYWDTNYPYDPNSNLPYGPNR